MNPEALTKNKFVDWCLSIVPESPVMKARYMYYLSTIIFIGLLGFSVATWASLANGFLWTILFQGLFMTAISLLSLAGLKQMRGAYHMTKDMFTNIKSPENGPNEQKEVPEEIKEMEVESMEEMLQAFKDE